MMREGRWLTATVQLHRKLFIRSLSQIAVGRDGAISAASAFTVISAPPLILLWQPQPSKATTRMLYDITH